jgi:eukaryotic-like serine/threonine-protein kinase
MGDKETDVRARARVGSVLKAKYRLDRVLGIGGMAAVYAATHLRNTNRVAVKILHRELAMDAGLRGRFLREGYAANSVEHPGTVRILDDDTAEDGAVFLVMELLDGETLEARWERKGRLPAEEVALLTYQLLDVLAAAHAKGIVHRDVKPENLFLTRERVLKVLDFGVARLLEGSVSATRSGGILGTPAFMAPEQVLGKTNAVDAQSDVWSIGATAFTLTSGRYVHEAETAEEMMVFTASRPARPLATVARDVPAPLAGVIDRALAFEKNQRWRSARSMQRAIVHAYQDAFGVPLPGARSIDDEEEADAADEKTTVMPEMAADGMTTLSDKTSVMVKVPGASPVATQYAEPLDSMPPARSPVAATIPMRQSTIAGVTATRTDYVSRAAPPRTGSGKRPRALFLVAIGGVAAVTGSVIVAKVVGSGQPSPAASATVIASQPPAASSAAASPEAIASIATIEPPSVAVEELPTTTHPQTNAPEKQVASKLIAAPLPPPPASTASLPMAPVAAPPPAATPPLKPTCTPPFTIDAKTGMKKWKVECL